MATSRIADQVGRVLGGRYRLIASLGTGASGRVYLADDVVLRRRVAVKVLHPALAADEGFLRRFRAEAQAAAALGHPNVMAVYDWGEDGDAGPFMVLEYLGGGSLRAMLDRGTLLSPSQALVVGLETCRALEYAHGRGFVHRDIKPANLLFGEDSRLRVADFGLARALAEAAWTEPAGAVLGTARYASPEQARGERVDGRADVYALSLVLVEAVTGEVPFAADTTIATLMARVSRPLEVPEALGPLGQALERAGRPDPAERPDAGDLAISLLAAAEELPRPAPLPLAGALASDETVVIPDRDPTIMAPARDTIEVVPDVETSTPYLAEEATRRRRRWPVVVSILFLALVAGAAAAWAFWWDQVPSYTVPTVVGDTLDGAKRTVRAFEWDVVEKKGREDGSKAGRIIDQNPKPGERLDEGGTFTVTVSLGNTVVPVPNMRGKPLAQAVKLLAGGDLKLGKVNRKFDETRPKDTVLGQASGKLPKGAAVDVTVSDGPQPRTVPDLTGASYGDAAKVLSELKLVVIREQEYSDDVEQDKVVRTSPAKGEQAPRDSTVTVYVSRGPEPVEVPRVRGMSLEDATERLERAGFNVTDVDGPPGNDVVGTDPAEGERRPRGTEITVITSRKD